MAFFTGAFAISRALTHTEQQRLAMDACLCFPEAPARLNLTAQFGFLPQDFWQAAQNNLMLDGAAADRANSDCTTINNCVSAAAVDSDCFPEGQLNAGTSELLSVSSCSSDAVAAQPESKATHRREGAASCTSQIGDREEYYGGAEGDKMPCGIAAGIEQRWRQQGTGPAAHQLLQKLRWATLGVPYDWTLRCYDHHALQRPIPQYLKDLAARLVHQTEVAEQRLGNTKLGNNSMEGAAKMAFQAEPVAPGKTYYAY